MKAKLDRATFSFIFVFCIVFVAGCQDFTPGQIHLSTQDDPAETITISWVTLHPQDTETHIVMYGISPGDYTDMAIGSSRRIPNEAYGYVHEVQLTGLEPATRYFYICGDETEGFSDEHSFTTAPSVSQDTTFVVIGDMGITLNALKNLDWMISESPSFVLHAGDLSYANGVSPKWDVWFQMIAPLAAEVAYMPAIGNHEDEDEFGFSAYLQRFALPNNERWYSFDWSNMHVIALDTESAFSPGSAQIVWLQNDLAVAAANPNIGWIFVFFHVPPYSASPAHGSNLNVRHNICPILEDYGVDVVFSGHDHLYERSFPLFNEQVVDSDPDTYVNPAGPIYVVTGGGGKSLYETGFEYWTAYTESTYHYVKVDIQPGGSLVLQAVSNDGFIIDQCWIYK